MTLRDAALMVRENAHAPYSGFKVGASVTVGYQPAAETGGANVSATVSSEVSKETSKKH